MVRAAWAQVAMVVSLLELVSRVGVGWRFMWALLELGELIVEHREGRSEPVGGGDGELLGAPHLLTQLVAPPFALHLRVNQGAWSGVRVNGRARLVRVPSQQCTMRAALRWRLHLTA